MEALYFYRRLRPLACVRWRVFSKQQLILTKFEFILLVTLKEWRVLRNKLNYTHTNFGAKVQPHQPSLLIVLSNQMLRDNVGIYRESQISSKKSNFGLYHPNNPYVWLFQKMILKNPQALCIWIILEKFENSQKNTIFIHEISHNFERFQRNSTGAKDLLLTSSSSHI